MQAKTKVYDSNVGYDLAAADYDKKEAYLKSFEKGCWAEILPDLKDKAVLDVGAGTGRLTGLLLKKGARVTALDVSKKMLEVLKKKFPAVSIQVGDAEDLPFPDESFDLVTAAFVVVHLKDPSIFFQETYRVLKPGGKLIITNINQKEAPPVKTEKGIIKIKSFYHRPEKVREFFEAAGFFLVNEKIINEGNTWVSQVIMAEKK